MHPDFPSLNVFIWAIYSQEPIKDFIFLIFDHLLLLLFAQARQLGLLSLQQLLVALADAFSSVLLQLGFIHAHELELPDDLRL